MTPGVRRTMTTAVATVPPGCRTDLMTVRSHGPDSAFGRSTNRPVQGRVGGLSLLGRSWESTDRSLERAGRPQHGRLVELVADQHHADGQAVDDACGDADRRVSGGVERCRVAEHVHRATDVLAQRRVRRGEAGGAHRGRRQAQQVHLGQGAVVGGAQDRCEVLGLGVGRGVAMLDHVLPEQRDVLDAGCDLAEVFAAACRVRPHHRRTVAAPVVQPVSVAVHHLPDRAVGRDHAPHGHTEIEVAPAPRCPRSRHPRLPGAPSRHGPCRRPRSRSPAVRSPPARPRCAAPRRPRRAPRCSRGPAAAPPDAGPARPRRRSPTGAGRRRSPSAPWDRGGQGSARWGRPRCREPARGWASARRFRTRRRAYGPIRPGHRRRPCRPGRSRRAPHCPSWSRRCCARGSRGCGPDRTPRCGCPRRSRGPRTPMCR